MREESNILIYIALHVTLLILSFVSIVIYLMTQDLKYGIVAIFAYIAALYMLILVLPDVLKEKLQGGEHG